MRHAMESKKQTRPEWRGSHGRRLHEVLLRRKEMKRSSSGGPRGRKVGWAKRCLCSMRLRLCFIC